MKRTPLRPGTKPLKAKVNLRRRKRLSPVNPERQVRMRLQQFGGQHRDRIISLPCCVCGARAPSDPAHTTARGMGGAKGKWWHLIPLCRRCHSDHDNYRGRFADQEVRRELELRAHRLAWESSDYGYAPEVPPVPRPGRL